MKIDLQQYRKILNVFLESKTPHVKLSDFDYLDSSEKSIKDDFLFHFQLIIDNGMIGNRNVETAYTLKDVGIEHDLNGNVYLNIMPLRLTQIGHDFASSLNSNEVFKQLKENFSDEPFKVILDTGQELLKHYAKKKLDRILEL